MDKQENKIYDVIIVGGSYAGLSAAMTLGRSLRKVLIIDSGKPCNRQAPLAHNLITHDGEKPGEIAAKAKEQVLLYPTINLLEGKAISGKKEDDLFEILTEQEEIFFAKKLLFATGLYDELPDLNGFSECWGISILHCPYCHGYEVKHGKIGLLGNGEMAYEFIKLLLNWSKDITLLSNGKCTLTKEQLIDFDRYNIEIIEEEIKSFAHENGELTHVVFMDDSITELEAIFTKTAFKQHCPIPEQLNCTLTEDHGFVQIDDMQRTTIPGVFAAGDCTTAFRVISGAMAQGTKAGACLNMELVGEEF